MAVLLPSDTCLTLPVLLTVSACLLFHASTVTGVCTFTDQTDTGTVVGTEVIYGTQFGLDLAGCKQVCLNDAACVALISRGVVCELSSSLPSIDPAGSGAVISTKICPAETTTAATTVGLPVSTAAPCTTTHSDTTGGDNYAAMLDASSSSSCRALCRVVDTCRAASYVIATNACSLFPSTGTSSASGVVHFQKNRCDDGSDCCFVESSGTQGSGSAALTFSATAASCQSLCERVGGCMAVTFKSGKCFLYGGSTSTSSLTGSVHVVNTCSTGSSTAGVLTSCNSALSATYNAAEVRTYAGILLLALLQILLGV